MGNHPYLRVLREIGRIDSNGIGVPGRFRPTGIPSPPYISREFFLVQVVFVSFRPGRADAGAEHARILVMGGKARDGMEQLGFLWHLDQ